MPRKHLFISGINQEHPYVNPRRGGDTFSVPAREHVSHGTFIKNKMERLWLTNSSSSKNYRSFASKDGLYIDIKSEPGFNLKIGSLENLRSDIKLMNVREVGVKSQRQIITTIFIPEDKKHIFLNKVNRYIEDGAKNCALLAGINDISKAVFESFWIGSQDLIPVGAERKWLEIWIDNSEEDNVQKFQTFVNGLNLSMGSNPLVFPERAVFLIEANRSEIQNILDKCNLVTEIRSATEIVFSDFPNNPKEIRTLIESIQAKTTSLPSDACLCILDTGVNNKHPLIEPFLNDSDLHSVDPSFGTNDDRKHGTLMAGTALYGDIARIAQIPSLSIPYTLESVKILPPPPNENPKELWGNITTEGVSLAEINNPTKKRIICLAITGDKSMPLSGAPTSWSTAIDSFSSGSMDNKKRLFIVSAGNIRGLQNLLPYPTSVVTSSIEEPAQAWNALTVGAYTEKDTIRDPSQSQGLIASRGQISPFSRSSSVWQSKWPIKPEIVMEGGNAHVVENFGPDLHQDLEIVSTELLPNNPIPHFDTYSGTSPAAAQASRFCALIQSEYPDAWPETIKALMVHSADWTEAMKNQFLHGSSRTDYGRLLRICGYGVPNIEKARYCLKDSLTLISQETLIPYKINESGEAKKNIMHFYDLPWPKAELEGLGELQVKMRVTLCYFIESNPGERGWKDKYLYSSSALRFNMNTPGESDDDFKKRINKAIREDDDDIPTTESMSDRWMLGPSCRDVGSIHSDIWQGTAVDLASSNKIAVYPLNGWWLKRKRLNKVSMPLQYSLIVSIESLGVDIDIYTPVYNQLTVPVPVQAVH